jgi:hypothetical protein
MTLPDFLARQLATHAMGFRELALRRLLRCLKSDSTSFSTSLGKTVRATLSIVSPHMSNEHAALGELLLHAEWTC